MQNLFNVTRGGGTTALPVDTDFFFDTLDDLLADTSTGWEAGKLISVLKGNFLYEVQATTASNYDLFTIGGQKLKVLPEPSQCLTSIFAFGAKGDGVADDTVAIDKALNWMIQTNFGICLDPPWDLVPNSRYLATFRYTGNGVVYPGGANKEPKICASAGIGKIRIKIESDVHLLSYSNIVSMYFEGFEVEGGRSLCVQTSTSANVQNSYIVRNMVFRNQSVCCVGGNSSDMPNWRITDNIVYQNDDTKLSFALSGLTDESLVARNTFFGGILKIGRGGNNLMVEQNFWPTSRAATGANLWILPQDAPTNAGAGCTLFRNKFGSEYTDTTAGRRILVAAEDTTAANGAFYERNIPLLASTDQYVNLPTIIHNTFSMPTNSNMCYLECWAARPMGLYFGQNISDGSEPQHIVRIPDEVVLYNSEITLQNVIDLVAGRNGLKACNRSAFGRVLDPANQMALDRSTEQVGLVCDPVTLMAVNGNDFSGNNANETAVASYLNQNTALASEFSFTADNGYAGAYVPRDDFDYTRLLSVHLMLKKGSINPLEEVNVVFYRRIGGSILRAMQTRRVQIYDDWITVNMTIQFQDAVDDALRIHIEPRDYLAGARESVVIDNIVVSHGGNGISSDHAAVCGPNPGKWNGPHMIFGDPKDGGAAHLFMDGNNLRLSIGSPTSATAGTLIGTAT